MEVCAGVHIPSSPPLAAISPRRDAGQLARAGPRALHCAAAPRLNRRSTDAAPREIPWTAAPAAASGSARAIRRGQTAHSSAGAVAAFSASLKVLIVNTNGGGHAPIGFWLSKKLAAEGHQVTIMTAGSQHDEKMNKPPFTLFGELTRAGVQTVWGDPADICRVLFYSTFDCVVDNNGKDLEAVGPVIEFAKTCGARQFIFVSSCGIYHPTGAVPHLEGDPVKADAGHVGVEEALASSGLAWASFRPQYITGYGSNKDCEEWFFDRIVRGRPVPIPGSGDNLCNIANAEDLGEMLAMAVGHPLATGIFNCVHNQGITHDALVRLCAKVMGVKCPRIVHYNPKVLGGRKAFPFRPMHFCAQPVKAQIILGWMPAWTLEETLKHRWEVYQSLGRESEDIDFSMDDAILDCKR